MRALTTVEEIEALPDGSIVLDGFAADPDAYKKDGSYWVSTNRWHPDLYTALEILDVGGPALLVWTSQDDKNPEEDA